MMFVSGRRCAVSPFFIDQTNKTLNMRNKTIERRTEEVILQTPRRIAIGRRTYRVAQPTAATLIMLSAEISELPTGMVADKELDIFTRTLRYAKDCGGIGRVAAVMMVGAWLTQFGGIGRAVCRWRIRCRARRLLANHTSEALNQAMTLMMREMQVSDFFALTAFLTGVNITRATKAETTASGRP